MIVAGILRHYCQLAADTLKSQNFWLCAKPHFAYWQLPTAAILLNLSDEHLVFHYKRLYDESGSLKYGSYML